MSSSSTELNEVRRFGLVAFPLFGLLATFAFLKARTIPTVFFGVLGFVGLSCLLLPAVMAPVHRVWMKVGRTVGRGLALVVLTLVYYLFLVPYAAVLKLFGKDPLHQKGEAASFWIEREHRTQKKELYERPY